MDIAWKKISERPYRAGHRHLSCRTFLLPDGTTDDYDIVNFGADVCILPFTPEGKIVLVRQYRPGPEKLVVEMPGGGVDSGETYEQAAARELLEETGLAGELTYVGNSLVSAFCDNVRHAFVAKNCRTVTADIGSHGEFLELVEMSVSEFRDHLRQGQLSDTASGYLALDFLGML